jgi:hypothetical protein
MRRVEEREGEERFENKTVWRLNLEKGKAGYRGNDKENRVKNKTEKRKSSSTIDGAY